MVNMMPKLKKLRSMLHTANPGCLLEVDGGVDSATAPVCRDNGADVLVAGSAYFKAADPRALVKLVHSL